MCPAYVKAPHLPEPTHGALDRTAELLAKLLSGSEDPDVTALSEAVKAKLGITEPLPKPALLSPSPGLSTLADDLKRGRVSRLPPKVTCPGPFLPRARTVPIAELQDVPVTETEKRGLSAMAPLAGVSPSGITPGVGKTSRPIAQANIQLELPEIDPKNLREWADEFAEFLLRQRLTAYLNTEHVYVPWVRWCAAPTCTILAHWLRRGVPNFPPSLPIPKGSNHYKQVLVSVLSVLTQQGPLKAGFKRKLSELIQQRSVLKEQREADTLRNVRRRSENMQ